MRAAMHSVSAEILSPFDMPRSAEPTSAERTLRGEAGPAAADAFVQRHQADPWRYLRMCGCPAHLADDLVQEALLAALHKRIDLLPEADATLWLRGAVRNLWRMHLRSERRRPPHQELALAEVALDRHADGDGGEATVRALRACVGRLEGRAKQALQLRYGEDAPRSTIAHLLELSEDGVKTLLRRTRKLLSECVARQLRREGDS